MSNVDATVLSLFREMVGEKAGRLSGSHSLADVNLRITEALREEGATSEERPRLDGIGFHLTDWQEDAAFLVALCLFPERLSDEEIREGVEKLLAHAPHHILEAARLGGYPTENIFEEEQDR